MINFQKKISGKIILTFFLLMVFCFGKALKVEATVWPGVDPLIKQGAEQISMMVNGLVVGTLKQQGIQALNAQVDALAGNGAGGEPAFITNWENFLIAQSQQEAAIYVNDFISNMTSGRGDSSYSTEGFDDSNYFAELTQTAKNSAEQILNPKQNIPKTTYEGDPEEMFSSDQGFSNLESYLSMNSPNNPWTAQIVAEKAAEEEMENRKFIAQTKAIAYQGFRGTPGDLPDSITSPGILAKESIANSQNMPNAVLAAATSVTEVVSSLVSQMINRSITQGFSSVQRAVSRTASTIDRFNSGVDASIDANGPGARFEY